jgi:hypothetical protein
MPLTVKTTVRSKRRPDAARARSPLSVTVSDELRRRLVQQADRRELKLATAARVLLAEHLDELEDSDRLERAAEWQKAQAWATWERIEAGDRGEVPWARLREHTRRALERMDARSRGR